MNKTKAHGTRFLLLWTVATALGGAVTGFLEGAGLQFFATLFLSGLLVGGAQALLIRRYTSAPLWVVVSSIGWLLGMQLAFILPTGELATTLTAQLGLWETFWLSGLNTPLWLAPVLVGQAWLLRKHIAPVLWIGVGLLAAIAHGLVSATSCYVACDALGDPLATAVVYASGWAVTGLATGVLLVTKRTTYASTNTSVSGSAS